MEDDDDPLHAMTVQAMDASLVTDDEIDNEPEEDEWDWNEGWNEPAPEEDEQASEGDDDDVMAQEPRTVDIGIVPGDGASSETIAVEPDEENKLPNIAAELLKVHHRFNHIGFAKLQTMAKCGVIPKRLANCDKPVCSACLYGKMTRRKWRDKPKLEKAKETVPITHAGQCVSVDMMKSPTPGLIAQISGWITRK